MEYRQFLNQTTALLVIDSSIFLSGVFLFFLPQRQQPELILDGSEPGEQVTFNLS